MSHPGNLPGEPGGQQPGGRQYPAPGAYDYPPIGYGGAPPPYSAPPPPYSTPPPGYSPPPQVPPWTSPPPPPHHAYDTGHPNHYGNPFPPAYGNPPATNGMAVGSLVSSLVGIPANFLCLPFIGSIVGVILGIVALNQIGKHQQKGKEMAVAGIAIGGVTLLGSLILVMVYSSKLFLY